MATAGYETAGSQWDRDEAVIALTRQQERSPNHREHKLQIDCSDILWSQSILVGGAVLDFCVDCVCTANWHDVDST